MEPENFLDQYVGVTDDGESLTLISKPDESCILLDGKNHYMVNPVKPEQCSGFPNTWFFDGWQDICEAVLVDEKHFKQLAEERDQNLRL